VGETVLFAGRNDFGRPLGRAVVERLGPCPSLPQVPDAIFTTIEARRGDSGSPIVDERYRIVGLVHGGARCRIAAPTSEAKRLLAEAREAVACQGDRAAARRGPCRPPARSASPRRR